MSDESLMDIKANYRAVLNDISAAAAECGRDLSDITLIAVSKTKPAEYVLEVAEGGAVDFGENKPQELAYKFDEINTGKGLDLRWHQIGHLQRNKVRHIIGKTVLIHSLDSIALAQEIEKRAGNAGIVQDVLIQVNISGEESKFGIAPEELDGFLTELESLEHIRVKGLMTISVRGYSSEQNYELFKRLKELADDHSLKELSMGMTHDYREAVRAGATLIRVGTAIFGERNYGADGSGA